MALSNIEAMVAGNNWSYINKGDFNIRKSVGRSFTKRKMSFDVAFLAEWTEARNSLSYTTQVFRSMTSFMPWSCNIPIGEGYLPKDSHSHLKTEISPLADDEFYTPLLPGLPDDVAKCCLALVPRSNFPVMGAVSKQWRSFIQSKEFIAVRKQDGRLEEWLYVLTADVEGKSSHWEIVDSLKNKHQILPLMPGPVKAGFGVVVLDGKLIVIAGYFVVEGTMSVSADVYQYESCLNRWSTTATLNVARYDFACAEVNGMLYAVGGYGANGESLSSVEVYDPDCNKWTLIESLRCPRWGCFACGIEGKLYVMGGRSSFSIGNSRFVDVYDTDCHTWGEMKNGCVMVTAHTVLDNKLFCMEWKNQRKLAIFNPEDNSWKMVPVPLTGSSRVGFRFGILNNKLLLLSLEEEPGYNTLIYDPNAALGSEWQTSAIKPSGLCLCSVTIKA